MMPLTSMAFIGFAFLITSGVASAFEPTRAAGLSVHLQPERIGRLRGETGGFDVLPQDASERRRLFPDRHALFEFFRRLPVTVRENGMWVVTTNPDAYADWELRQLADLEILCRGDSIALFVIRASKLPDGWERRN